MNNTSFKINELVKKPIYLCYKDVLKLKKLNNILK